MAQTPPRFTAGATDALTRNGWRILTSHTARRDYRGGSWALITAGGQWTVFDGPTTLSGTEPDWCCAAMEANEQAWSRPSYAAAKYGANVPQEFGVDTERQLAGVEATDATR